MLELGQQGCKRARMFFYQVEVLRYLLVYGDYTLLQHTPFSSNDSLLPIASGSP